MKVIGLTGGFGTGKTYVASIFKSLGAKVIDADEIAHKVMVRGAPAYKKIISRFGKEILDRKGNIDRRKLGALAFLKKEDLNALNRIVHPAVIRTIKKGVAKAEMKDMVIIDAPLLVEAGAHRMADYLIVVKCSMRKQIGRCAKKFGMTKEDVLERIRRQMPLAGKIRLADYVVDNGGLKSETRRQVRKIWREMSWR